MDNTLNALFVQAPGLASSFDSIFNAPTAAPVAPPTPAVLPAPRVIPSHDSGDYPLTF
jgi:hypothetical protein